MDNAISSKTVTGTVTARILTAGQRLNDLDTNRSIVLEKVPHGGSLEGRRLPSGAVQFYWRHTQEGRTERIAIGPYDSSAPPKALKPSHKGYSVAAALEAARDLAKENMAVPGGLRGKRERDAQQRKRELQLTELRTKHTLSALCEQYVSWLRQLKRVSHSDAKNIFDNHVNVAWPDLASKPAAEIDKRDIVMMLRRLSEEGKLTTARKLRSYLRAAFGCAVRADSDASLPTAFIEFSVSTNPVESTAAIAGRSAKQPLSLPELRRYWRELEKEPDVIGAALRLHLLSGGQRPAQLVRLRAEHVGGQSFQLLDGKGRRLEPRSHLLPVTAAIKRELGKLSRSGYVMSTDGGTTAMHPTSLSVWSNAVADRAGIPDFQLKRVRSGVETALAEAGVSLHVRGLLQSHGVGGVQERHYDAHTYLAEKHHALEALLRLLRANSRTNVVTLRRRRA